MDSTRPGLEELLAADFTEGLRTWSEQERRNYCEEIGDIPLFQETVNPDDPMVQALTALQYENETPESLALHFKQKGNEMVNNAKKLNKLYWRNALQYYTEGLEWLQKAQTAAKEKAERGELVDDVRVKEENGKEMTLSELHSTILSNRAAVNLALKNYRSVIDDALHSLSITPLNIKSWYRLCKASHALKRDADTVRYCEKGLEIDPDNKEIKKLLEASQEALRQQEELKRKKDANLRAHRDKVDKYRKLCEQRGIKVGKSAFSDSRIKEYQGKAYYDEEDRQMRWPVLFFYDEYGQSDFIEGMGEDDRLREHLELMFPEKGSNCAWDERDDYRASRLVILMEGESTMQLEDDEDWYREFECAAAEQKNITQEKKKEKELKKAIHEGKAKWWLDVDPLCTLKQVLQHPKCVVPGIPIFNVMVRDSKVHQLFCEKFKGRILALPADTRKKIKNQDKVSPPSSIAGTDAVAQSLRSCQGGCGRREASEGEFSLCARCQVACYCSRECQKKAWKEHKKTCHVPSS